MSARHVLGTFICASVATAAVAGSALMGCGGDTPPAASPTPASTTTSVAVAPVADPPPFTEGQVTLATIHGMTVLVQRIPGAEFVEGNLYIRGGVRNLSEGNQGIEALGLQVSASGGTQALAKEPFTRKLGSIGATLGFGAHADYSVLEAKAPTASWDQTYDLLTSAFLTPALPPSEVELVRARMISDLTHEKESGDGRLILASRQATYAGHPYALREIGTPESMAAITTDALTPYLQKLRQTNRLVLVVVGDIDPAHVQDQVKKSFASVPAGDYQETPVPPIAAKNTFVKDPVDLPTSYVMTTWAAPSWSDPDYAAAWLGMDVLSFRVFEEVRTKRNLSYAPDAGLYRRHARAVGYLYVTATDPDTTMKVMMDEARRLQNEPIPDAEFAAQKAQFITEFSTHQETTQGRAALLGTAIVLGGDWHLADQVLPRVKAVTQADVQRVAKSMMTNLDTAIVGHPEKLPQATVQMQPSAPAR